MKKIMYFCMGMAILSFTISCSSKKAENTNTLINEKEETVDTAMVEEAFNIIKERVIHEIKSYGAKDAYVDNDNYFVYGVEKSDLAASGDEVASAMFPMVDEIPGIKGVKVIDVNTKEVLGVYNN